jgi:hypothetical protein
MGSETLERPYAKRIDDVFGKPLKRSQHAGNMGFGISYHRAG